MDDAWLTLQTLEEFGICAVPYCMWGNLGRVAGLDVAENQLHFAFVVRQ